jgi:hypothetical protein
VRYCESENLYLVLGFNSNAHHIVWGSTNCNRSGKALVEFLNSSNLEILNQDNKPNLGDGGRLEVVDITLGSFGLLESIASGKVFYQSPLYRITDIMFTL